MKKGVHRKWVNGYHIDAEKVSLDDLQKRLEATDLCQPRFAKKGRRKK